MTSNGQPASIKNLEVKPLHKKQEFLPTTKTLSRGVFKTFPCIFVSLWFKPFLPQAGLSGLGYCHRNEVSYIPNHLPASRAN
jgi:hypothetical protein